MHCPVHTANVASIELGTDVKCRQRPVWQLHKVVGTRHEHSRVHSAPSSACGAARRTWQCARLVGRVQHSTVQTKCSSSASLHSSSSAGGAPGILEHRSRAVFSDRDDRATGSGMSSSSSSGGINLAVDWRLQAKSDQNPHTPPTTTAPSCSEYDASGTKQQACPTSCCAQYSCGCINTHLSFSCEGV